MDKTTYICLQEAEQKARSLSRRLERLQRFRHQYAPTNKQGFPYRHLADFFHSQRAPLQSFVVNNQESVTITGEQGTTLSLAPNSLLDLDNQVVKGDINIQLREVRTKADMIFSNLPSTSEDRLLETGGAFYLDIHQGYLPLRLQHPLSVSLPLSPAIANTVALRLHHGVQSAVSLQQATQIDWQPVVNNTPSLQRKTGIKAIEVQLLELHWSSLAYLFRSGKSQRSILHVRPQLTTGALEEIQAYVVYQEINCVAKLHPHRDVFSLYNLPKQQPFTIIIIGRSQLQFYYGQLDVTSVHNKTYDVPLKNIEEEELIRQINAL